MLFAEAIVYLAAKGKTVFQRLEEIFDEFGYYTEKNFSVEYKGAGGAEKMKEITSSLRSKIFPELGGEEILYTADYLTGIRKYPSGPEEKFDFPRSDTLYYAFAGGGFAAVRPSGTEPKLKVYTLAVSGSEETAKNKAGRIASAIKKEL